MRYKVETKKGKIYKPREIDAAGIGFMTMKFWDSELKIPANEIQSVKRTCYVAREETVKQPGYRELVFISFLVSPKKIEQLYEPIIADWNAEYYEELSKGRSSIKLLLIRLRYTWALVSALSLDVFLKSVFSFLSN